MRRVKTASGATAVQIVHKRGRTVLGIEHVGSAHDDAQLAMLLETAQARLNAGQDMLPIADGSAGGRPVGQPVVEGTASLIVWETLEAIYHQLGFGQIGDNAFQALVLARIIEPTSKADTVRVLAELGVPGPTRVTFMRCLKRVIERDYRTVIATACYTHAVDDGGLAMVVYDLTTLHFETDIEDRLRKVGMSKERRVDPQVTVGLLTHRVGVPVGCARVRREQGRDQDPDPGSDWLRRTPPRQGCDRRRRRRHVVRGEPARLGGGRVRVHRRVQTDQCHR